MKNTTQYAAALVALQKSIIDALSDIAVHNSETDDWEVTADTEVQYEADSNSQADAAEAAEERITTLAELETRYRNISRALIKITDGTYGICEVSGTPIEPERLQANPAARTCIAHKEEEYRLPL